MEGSQKLAILFFMNKLVLFLTFIDLFDSKEAVNFSVSLSKKDFLI